MSNVDYSSYTDAELDAELSAVKAARLRVLNAQEYSEGDFSLKRVDMDKLDCALSALSKEKRRRGAAGLPIAYGRFVEPQ